MTAIHTNHSQTFRALEAGRLYEYLRAGDSCQIIGIGSSGKSRFLRFLMEDAVRAKYLGPDHLRYLLIYLDANKLLRRDDWGLYELMLHQLLMELEARGADEGLVQAVDALHGRAVAKETLHLALRYLDRALSLVIKKNQHAVVFLIDEFDDLARELPPACFSALRALRDDHKYALMYVTASRRQISSLRDNPAEIESFDEMLSGNTIWLMAYSEPDAREMIGQVASRYQVEFAESQVAQMLAQTGCHPGLMRGILRLSRKGEMPPVDQWVLNPVIQEECAQIWRSLPVLEQRAMIDFAGGREMDMFPNAGERLREKGLIVAAPGGAQIFAPLFRAYILVVKPVAGALIDFDRAHRKVWVQGKPITDLTAQEYSCLDYLEQNHGKVCRPEDIGRYYDQTGRGERRPEKTEEPVDGEDKMYRSSIEAIIKRLRKKIEPDPAHPRFIKTIRAIGYLLDDGG